MFESLEPKSWFFGRRQWIRALIIAVIAVCVFWLIALRWQSPRTVRQDYIDATPPSSNAGTARTPQAGVEQGETGIEAFPPLKDAR